MPNLEPYLQLGGTVIVALMAFWAVVQIIKNKKVDKNNNDVFKNHFGTIDTKLDLIIEQGRSNEEKLEKIINLLIEIREKIGK